MWARVIATVRPLAPGPAAPPPAVTDRVPRAPAGPARPTRLATPAIGARKAIETARPAIGETLDSGWDRRLRLGQVAPDQVVDLHGHTLASAHDRLDRGLDQAIRSGARLLLLVTGKPRPASRATAGPVRGAIRAAVGDWLAASRHAPAIAAVRSAHQRHGGAGALYIVLRRQRTAPRRD